MNFLVILICLTINYVWLKDFDRFNDDWFFHFRERVMEATAGLKEKFAYGWLFGIAVLYAIPLLIVGVLLLLADDLFFGLLVMLLHVLVLLVAFDRTQPGKLASEFLAIWRLGDLQACKQFLQKELTSTEDATVDALKTDEQLAEYFSNQLTYRFFERMFVMFFWYVVAGPLAVVICYISYQLRDCHGGAESEIVVYSNEVTIRVLEWVPMRLLVLSFSLAGNFVKCFDAFKEIFWKVSMEDDYADLLHRFALTALDGSPYSFAGAESPGANDTDRVRIGEEIQALQALLERSQLIWLSVLALITVFGINS